MSLADRVRKLAALAGSDNEHESNAAAQQVCRLIREGKVVVQDPGEEVQEEVAFRWPPWASEVRVQRPAPPAKPARRVPKGPFSRDTSGRTGECIVCGEPIEPGEAFTCPEGRVHGDCIPHGQRP